MKRRLQSMPWLLLAAALGGCAPTLPVVVKPVSCLLPADQLASSCELPRALADSITYADLIAIAIDDRKALRACAAHDQLLAKMILACQDAIKAYNEQLVEINQKITGKP